MEARTHSRHRLAYVGHVLIASVFVVALATASGCGYTQVKTAPPEPPGETYYYDESYYEDDYPPDGFPALDPFGRWVYVEPVGWAWHPDVYRDWRPYHHGHWNWTDWGWTWVSYEPFGWAVYHYGNWVVDPYWGWVWLPDYEWYPNRVSWIVYDDYICWAPMPIHHYAIGDPWMHEYDGYWNVSRVDDFQQPYVGDYRVRNFRPTVYKHESRVIYKAPEISYIQMKTGRNVTKVAMRTKPVIGGKTGLKKIETPSEEQIRMRELRTRTRKDYHSNRNKDANTKGGRGTQPNVMTRPDSKTGKSKQDSKPTKQEPEAKQKKEKKPQSKSRSSTKPKSSKDKSSKDKKKGKDDGK